MQPVEIEFLVKNNTRPGLEGVSSGVDGVAKTSKKAKARIRELEAEIQRLKETAATFDLNQEENIRQIEALKKRITELQSTTKQTTLVPPNAPAAIKTYNGLTMSVQQLARELPALSMGPQMFFLAISNNLPIFTDELARARKEVQAINAAGGKAVPVWRQLLSSIISWQTLLAAGITVMVMYGKEIGQWVKSLFKGREALDVAALAAEKFHATMLQGARNAQNEVVKLNLLYKAATNNARSMNERRTAAEKLQDLYPKYFGNLDREQIMLGKASEAYKTLVANIYEYAKAQAAFKNLVDVSQRQQVLTGSASLTKYLRWERILNERTRDLENAKNKVDAASFGAEFDRANYAHRVAVNRKEEAEKKTQALEKQVKAELEALPNSEEIISAINDKFDGSIGAYIDALEAEGKRLQDIATKATITENPVEPLKITTPETGDSLEEQYEKERRDRQEEINDQTIELEKEGAERERAEIRAEYDKKVALYEEQERRILELLKKMREKGIDIPQGAELDVIAETNILKDNAAKSRDRALAEVDAEERASYDKLLEKYETYQQGRLRIAEKYDKEIAALADNPENQELARMAKQKALDDFTQTFAEQFPEFQTWADWIASLAIDTLREEVVRAEQEIAKLKAEGAGSSTLGVAEAKLARARSVLDKKDSETSDETTDTSKWEDLHNVLGEVIDTFNDVGDAIGGVGGRIISTAGNIAASSLQIVNAVKAVQTAKEANDALGMASGILGGIGAGISILTTLFSLLDAGETSLERNLRLAREFNDELLTMKQRARIDSNDTDTIFGARHFDRFKGDIDAAREALEKFEMIEERVQNRGEEMATGTTWANAGIGNTDLAHLKKVAKEWDNVAESVANMQVQVRHATWFRVAQYSSLGDLLPGLFTDGELDMDALKMFVEEGGETFQHLTYENRMMLEEMTEQWELYQEAIESVRDYLRDIFGDLGDSMTEAMIRAAENGTDAFDVMAEDIGQTLRALGQSMVSSAIIGPIIEEAQKAMENITMSDMSDTERFAAWTEVLRNMMGEAAAQQDNVKKLWDELSRYAEDNGFSIEDAESTTQSGRAGAIQTVTQESFSRVEGLITSMQIHDASIDENIEGIVPVLGQSLEALNLISRYCEVIPMIYELLRRQDVEGLKIR